MFIRTGTEAFKLSFMQLPFTNKHNNIKFTTLTPAHIALEIIIHFTD